MPTYEYVCRECGQHLEVVQSFTDEPLTECSGCGGTLRKVFSPIGISFKGSGFYKNDSRSKSSTSTPAANGSGDTASTSDSTSKSESTTKSDSAKPAAGKSESTPKAKSA